jgi:hypothetical protein
VARRNRAAEAKIYRLANTPCTPTSVTDHLFTVDNGNSAVEGTPRDRSVGLNNRIIGGILLHTWRKQEEVCPMTRFSAIQVGWEPAHNMAHVFAKVVLLRMHFWPNLLLNTTP